MTITGIDHETEVVAQREECTPQSQEVRAALRCLKRARGIRSCPLLLTCENARNGKKMQRHRGDAWKSTGLRPVACCHAGVLFQYEKVV